MHRFNMLVGASVTAVVAATAAATVVTYRTGPSSSANPYVVAADGSPVREIVSILTVGDSIGGFQLLGIPDGIGSFMEGDNVRIAIDHEHTSAMNSGQHPFQSGSVSGGSSISKWLVNPATFEVLSGGEAMTSLQTVTNGTGGALNDGFNAKPHSAHEAPTPATEEGGRPTTPGPAEPYRHWLVVHVRREELR